MSAPGWLRTAMQDDDDRCVMCGVLQIYSEPQHNRVCRWAEIAALIEQMGEALRVVTARSEQVFFLNAERAQLHIALAAYERGPGQSEPDR